ncbi:hypothetical protein J4G37_24880 [Microvirga sp. 3-52]|nr:hypothetical protein [Microvirga sp. 3-52]
MAKARELQRGVSGLTPSRIARARGHTLPDWTYFSERKLEHCFGVPDLYFYHLRVTGAWPKYLTFGLRVLYHRRDVEVWIKANLGNATSKAGGGYGKA